uniref:Variant surface glycoprotein 1125.4124 n=1 Tax=Trypanosoma brucei TaxID=5691 RepID=A0A1J0R9U8_9TRYP|nr:variant surface glycoprotein 1125.4124 [Trypanosoma brucei]
MSSIIYIAVSVMSPALGAKDQVAAKVTDVCKEKKYLQQPAGRLTAEISKQEGDLSSLETDLRLWKLAAVKQDKRQWRLYTALFFKATSLHLEQAQKVKNTRTKIGHALQLTERHVGAINAIQELARTKVTERASKHGTNGATKINIALERTTGGAQLCKPLVEHENIDDDKPTPDFNFLDTIQLTATSMMHKLMPDDTLTLTGNAGCSGGQTNVAFSAAINGCTYASGQAIETTASAKENIDSGTTVKVFKTDKQMQECATQSSDSGGDTAFLSELGKAICEALIAGAETVETLSDANGNKLSADDLIPNAVRNCGAAFSNIDKPSDSTSNKEFVNYLKTRYRDTTKVFKQTFGTNAGTTHVELRQADKTDNKPINQTTTPEQQAAVLSNSEGERIKNEVESEKENTVTASAVDFKTTEEKCEDKPHGECKEEDGCEFKVGECKVKEGVKAEEKKEERCAGKGEKECKAPGCKLEDEMCKCFSIMVKEHFAMMVSAFMSLVAF